MSRSEPRKHSFASDSAVLNTPASLKLPQKFKPGTSAPPHKPAFSRNKSYANKGTTENDTDKLIKNSEAKGTRLSSVLADISQFTADALNTFNPEYAQFERNMSNSLEKLQVQIERLSTMKMHAVKTAKEFESQIEVTKSDFVKELEELHKWQAPKETLETIRERVMQLKDILNSSKEKLASIDAELTHTEEQLRRERRQVRTTITGTQLVLCVFIVFVAYYFFVR